MKSNVMYRLEQQDREQTATFIKYLIGGLLFVFVIMNWGFFQNSVFPFIGEMYISAARAVSEGVTAVFMDAFIN